MDLNLMRYRTYKKDQWELHWMSCGMSQCQILVRTLKQHRELKTSNLAGTTLTVLDTAEHTPKKKHFVCSFYYGKFWYSPFDMHTSFWLVELLGLWTLCSLEITLLQWGKESANACPDFPRFNQHWSRVLLILLASTITPLTMRSKMWRIL